MMPKKAALFYEYPIKDGEVFGQGRRQTIENLTDLYPEVVNAKNFDEHASNLGDIEVIFGTWGMPRLSDEQLGKMPKLEAVFYAAGNVRAFAQPIFDNYVMLVGAWDMNAIPVARWRWPRFFFLAGVTTGRYGIITKAMTKANPRNSTGLKSTARPSG